MLPKSRIESKLEKEINAQLDLLVSYRDDPEKYAATVERISKLHKLKAEEGIKLPSLDNVLFVSANVFGILWLTRYEREHPITSKALGFVFRPR